MIMLHSLKIFVQEMCCSVSDELRNMSFANELCHCFICVDTWLTIAGCLWLEAAIKYMCRSVQGVADKRM